MAGRIQNEDIKSVAELTAAGGAANQLPNDDKVWVKAGGINKTLNQAISDGDLGSGGGAGGVKNYFPNQGKFNSTIASVSAFNTTFSGGIPTTITPGSTKVAVALETTAPLSGAGSLKFSITTAASSTGHGFISTAMTIDDADLARGFLAQFDYFISSGLANLDISGTETATLQAWVYNVGLAKWYQLKNFNGITSGTYDTLITSFSSELDKTSNANQYRFALIVANDPTGTADILIDSFYFGRSALAQPDLTSLGIDVNGNQGGTFTTAVAHVLTGGVAVEDHLMIYDPGTGKATIKVPGKINVKGGVIHSATFTAGQGSSARIFHNGNLITDSFMRYSGLGTVSIFNDTDATFYVQPGDEIWIAVYSEGSSPSLLNTLPYDKFQIEYLESDLGSGAGITTPVVFRSATSVSGTLNSSFNLADFGGGIIEDTLSCYSAGQYKVKKPDFYDLGASIYVAGSPAGAGEFTAISIRVNNTDVASSFSRTVTSGGNGPVGAQAHTKGVWLNAGDIVECYVATSIPSPSYSSGLSAFENNFYIVTKGAGAKTDLSSSFIPRLYVYNGSSGTLAGSTTQKIALDTFYGTDSNNCKEWFDTSLNRFTPKKPGIWNFKNGLFLTGTTNRSYAVIIKNGTELWASAPSGGISGDVGMNGGADIPFNGTTDYVELYGFTFGGSSGIPSSYVDTYLQARWVSDL